MNKLLEVQDIYKDYYQGRSIIEVLHDVNLSLEKSEIICIIGASGSGKSTLLNIIGLLDNFTSGKLFLMGEEVSQNTSEIEKTRLRRNNLGFIHQNHYILNDFTALENVMIPLILRGDNKNSAIESATSLLEELGLGKRLYNYPPDLSGGELQRISFCRAIVTSPKLLLADEPTGNLDSFNAQEVFSLILKYSKLYSMCSVVVTHNEVLAQQASKIYKLDDGRLERVR